MKTNFWIMMRRTIGSIAWSAGRHALFALLLLFCIALAITALLAWYAPLAAIQLQEEKQTQTRFRREVLDALNDIWNERAASLREVSKTGHPDIFTTP